MTITLIFLAFLMGAVIWWLFRQTVDVQPWVAHASAADVHASVLQRPTAKMALGVFLAVATSLFALFISAYAMRMHYGDWKPVPEPSLLWWNTGVLVATSVVMQAAVRAARRADLAALRNRLLIGGALTCAFLIGQFLAWQQLDAAGYYLASNPANGFFYLLTAVHAVHVLGGLVAWGRTAARLRSDEEPARLRLGVELCATYWHFLLIVWFVLFGLLLLT